MKRPTYNLREFASAIACKHHAVYGGWAQYTGTVTLHGMARLASESKTPQYVEQARKALMPFVRGDVNFDCNFPNYLCGETARPGCCTRGCCRKRRKRYGSMPRKFLHDAPKDPEGILE